MSNSDWSKPVLVYQANGVQGGAIVKTALRHGLKVRALVRDPVRANALERYGAELAPGDLADLSSLAVASQGAVSAVIQVPTGSFDEMQAYASHAFQAAKIAGLSSVILRLPSASRTAPCDEPSFVANAMVEDIARQSGILSAIVRPTMYLENLLKPTARADIITRGIFEPPLAASQRVAWTSADDCAEVTIRLLMGGKVFTGDYTISGPESLSGDALARKISVGLGRPVTYRSQPLDKFEHEVEQALGSCVGRRVASKFRYFAAHPEDADAILSVPYTRRFELGDFNPTSVETWVANHLSDFLRGSEVD